ncbi:hypothetical protein HMI55_003267 [Coelomomyces lativittatus]|nr:hypothetical protein HMI55_003267 [Coelomomyces lativittatus]
MDSLNNRHPMATAPASLPAPSSTSSTSSTNLKGGPSIPPPHLSSTFASSVPPPVPKKKYRDRAEERRQGLNLDYQDTATLLQTLRGHGHGHASLPLGSTRSSLLSASSLLSLDDEVEVEVKKTLSKNEHLGSPDTSNFTSSQHPLVVHSTAGSSKKRLLTPFIKTILEAALKKPKPPSFSNPHCYPGRMAYVFPLPSSNPSISLPPHNSGSGDHGPRLSSPPSSSVLDSSHVTVVLRSTDQVKPLFKEQVEIIDQILTFLATKKKKKSHSHVPSSSVSEDPLAPSSEDPLHFLPPENHPVPPLHDVLNHHKITPPLHLVNQEDEDDIFADAGRDYSIPIEKEVIMTTKDEVSIYLNEEMKDISSFILFYFKFME